MSISRVRVAVIFEKLDEDNWVVIEGTKYGNVITTNFGPVEQIAQEACRNVYETISKEFPDFLEVTK